MSPTVFRRANLNSRFFFSRISLSFLFTDTLSWMQWKRRAALTIGVLSGTLVLGGCGGMRATSAAEDSVHGRLLIVGGGPVPAAIRQRFLELAGGPARARIAIFPTASQSEDAGVEITAEFEKMGARAERIVLTRAEAEKEGFPDRLEGVTGIWFGGGDQSRITAAISGTPVEAAIRKRYREGAVVGGTSAGAAVMSAVMITGDERRPGGARPPSEGQGSFLTIDRDNVVTSAGLGLVEGVIVDQHFVRRRRHNRLISLVLENPRLVGVGIDESTAAEVSNDGWWTVIGESVLVVYDARRARIAPLAGPLGAAGIAMHVLPAGSRYRPSSGEVRLPEPGR
jgi:cyanophycinase